MALLVFAVLPKLDVVKAVMLTNAVCLVPAILGIHLICHNFSSLVS